MSSREELIADVTAEAANTLRVLEAVPADRLAWRPHEKSMTLAVLAGHLAEIPGWVLSLMQDELDFAGITDYTPFIPSTRVELLEDLPAERHRPGADPGREGRRLPVGPLYDAQRRDALLMAASLGTPRCVRWPSTTPYTTAAS